MDWKNLRIDINNLSSLAKQDLLEKKDAIQSGISQLRDEMNDMVKADDPQRSHTSKGGVAYGDYSLMKETYECLLESLGKVEVEIAKRANSAKGYDKYRLFSNIRELCKQKGIKLGSIEKEANVAPGYMSRLDKESNSSEPTVDFVVTAARVLSVSIDDLLKRDFSKLTPNEIYLTNFIEKLIKDTRDDKLEWEHISAENITRTANNNEGNIFSPLYDDKRKYMTEREIDLLPYDSSFNVLMSHSYGIHTSVSDTCFKLNMGNDSRLYVTSVENNDDTRPISVVELWLQASKDSKPKFLTSTMDKTVGDAVKDLYYTLLEQMHHPSFSKEIKSIIDAFMDDEQN